MEEDTLFNNRFGKGNPFVVPEGYFTDFEKKLLEGINASVPAEKPLLRRLNPWLWTAVSVAAVVSGLVLLINKPDDNQYKTSGSTAAVSTPQSDAAEYMIDQVSDYAMVDNSDLYSYVADE